MEILGKCQVTSNGEYVCDNKAIAYITCDCHDDDFPLWEDRPFKVCSKHKKEFLKSDHYEFVRSIGKRKR